MGIWRVQRRMPISRFMMQRREKLAKICILCIIFAFRVHKICIYRKIVVILYAFLSINMKHFHTIWLSGVAVLLLMTSSVSAQTQVHISDPASWRTSSMSKYAGQVVTLDVPFYVCNNYNGTYTISPQRVMSPTNQASPASAEYNSILSVNSSCTATLSGVTGYHRMGERLTGLTVKVNSASSWTASGPLHWEGNTREDILKTDVRAALSDEDGEEPSLVVCAANLEYFLVANTGSGTMGPATRALAQEQRNKVRKALALIRADIYGFVEIEQGGVALDTLARMMTAITGDKYEYVKENDAPNGTFTKSSYIYNSKKVEPVGVMQQNNMVVSNRKRMIAFRELTSNERFIFSINHFKAKSGTGSGDDADKKDGQGSYNASRVKEAQSVLDEYKRNQGKNRFDDPDILIMGDLNAYAMEDPIQVLLDGGMTDLHRYFHADSSYSYTYHGTAGYLDHALCNKTLRPQVTGMMALHINSDEDDYYTYNGRKNDGSMFRYSDHDPVLVGLNLNAGKQSTEKPVGFNTEDVVLRGATPTIYNADGGYYTIHLPNGMCVGEGHISEKEFSLGKNLQSGLYIVHVYAPRREDANVSKTFKLLIR